MTACPSSRTTPAASRMTCWPASVMAFATAGEKSREIGDPRTPKREVMRIFTACGARASRRQAPRRVAPERAPAGRAHDVRARAGLGHVGERIDVERPYEARV